MTPTRIELATFWSGVRRATIAPRSHLINQYVIKPYLSKGDIPKWISHINIKNIKNIKNESKNDEVRYQEETDR